MFSNPIQAGQFNLIHYDALPSLQVFALLCQNSLKLLEVQCNYIGYHLKQLSGDSNLGCCHGNIFVKEHLAEIFSFL